MVIGGDIRLHGDGRFVFVQEELHRRSAALMAIGRRKSENFCLDFCRDRTAAGGLSQPFGPHLWYPFDFTQTVPVADNERYRQAVHDRFIEFQLDNLGGEYGVSGGTMANERYFGSPIRAVTE